MASAYPLALDNISNRTKGTKITAAMWNLNVDAINALESTLGPMLENVPSYLSSLNLTQIASADDQVPITIMGHSATQTANLFEVYDYQLGSLVFSIGPDGAIFSTASLDNITVGTSAADEIPLTVKGYSGQTDNLTEWQNSSDVMLTCIGDDGHIGVGITEPAFNIVSLHTPTGAYSVTNMLNGGPALELTHQTDDTSLATSLRLTAYDALAAISCLYSGTAIAELAIGINNGTSAVMEKFRINNTTTFIQGISGNAALSSLSVKTTGAAQSELAGIAFYPTFVGTGDNSPRRAADIIAGFNGGSWNTQYLAFRVGYNANDAADLTPEVMRLVGLGDVVISGGGDIALDNAAYLRWDTTPGTLANDSWGQVISSDNLLFQRFETGAWATKLTLTSSGGLTIPGAVDANGIVTITSSADNLVPLTIEGYSSSQSANLINAYEYNGGSIVFSVEDDGWIFAPGVRTTDFIIRSNTSGSLMGAQTYGVLRYEDARDNILSGWDIISTPTNTTGTITSYGTRIVAYGGASGSTTSSIQGIQLSLVAGDGTVENTYGLYISNVAGVGTTNNYAIYAAGGLTYLGGNTEIAGTISGTQLAISGHASSSKITVTGIASQTDPLLTLTPNSTHDGATNVIHVKNSAGGDLFRLLPGGYGAIGNISASNTTMMSIGQQSEASGAFSTNIQSGLYRSTTSANVYNLDIKTTYASSSGTVTALYNAYSQLAANNSTISNFYHYFAKTVTGTAIANVYGLYVEDQTAGTSSNYAIYTNAGAVRLGGAVTCASTLTVSGALTTLTGASGGSVNALLVNPGADSNTGIVIKNNSGSQTANPFECQNSGGAAQAWVGPNGRFTSYGAGQASVNYTDAGSTAASLYVRDADGGLYNGGAVIFGAYQGSFCGIKGALLDGGGNSRGDMVFMTRINTSDTQLTNTMTLNSGGTLSVLGDVISSTGNFCLDTSVGALRWDATPGTIADNTSVQIIYDNSTDKVLIQKRVSSAWVTKHEFSMA